MTRDRENTGKDPLIPFVVTLLGVAVLSSPLDWKYKIVTSTVAATPGLAFAFSEWHLYKDRRRETERLQRENKAIEDGNRQLSRALDAREEQLKTQAEAIALKEAEATQLKAQAEEEAARRLLEAETEANSKLSEIVQIEAATKGELDLLKVKAEAERDRILEDARRAAADLIRSYEQKQAGIKAETEEARQRCAEVIKAARRKWRDRQALLADEWKSSIKADQHALDLDRKALEMDRQALQQEIALERTKAAESIAKELADIEKRKQDAQTEIDRDRETFEEEKARLLEEEYENLLAENRVRLKQELDNLNAQLAIKQGELDALIAETNRELEDKTKELQAFYNAQYENWLIPHVQETNRLIEERDDWKSRYYEAENELAASKDIVLPENPFSKDFKMRAYCVQLWLKSQGIMVNYYNASIDEEGVFTLQFKPWQNGSKFKKSLEGVLDGMVSTWGLLARPVIGETTEAWFIKMPYAASKARSLEEEFSYFGQFGYTPHAVPSYDRRLDEPESLQSLDPDTRRAVMDQATAEERITEMLRFRPSPLPKPVNYDISPLELKCADWLCNWRASATRNDSEPQQNIREVNKLITTLYNVKIGSASESRDRNTGESLRQRVHRICKLLKIELRRRDEELDQN